MIDLDVKDGVAWLRLDRPRSLNALDRSLTGALEDTLPRVAAMDNVTVLVVAGRGRAFCAGNDIAEMATLTGDEAEALATRQAALLARFADLPQVTIAAIDGWALGGGLMLAVAQDLRVASDRARFGLPEVTLGFNPAYGIARLLDVVAGGWACELLLTGRTIHASEALRMGLVNRVVAPPTLEASVAALAADIARAPRTGLAATKEIVAAIRRGERACGPEAYGAALRTSPEARARIRAFVEPKRSLIALNWTTSSTSMSAPVPRRRATAARRRYWSSNARRLASPVTGSGAYRDSRRSVSASRPATVRSRASASPTEV